MKNSPSLPASNPRSFQSLATKDDSFNESKEGSRKSAEGIELLSGLSSHGQTVEHDQLPLSIARDGKLDKSRSYLSICLADFSERYPKICTVLLALVAGAVGTFGGVGFKLAWESLRSVYTAQQGFVSAARVMPHWQRLLIPLTAGLIGGAIAYAFRKTLSHKAFGPEYVEAVRDGNGRLNAFPNLVRSALAVVIVAGGYTLGREGTMVQFSALSASILGQFFSLPVKWQRLCVAFGAAAGFSAAYLAPISATMFLGRVIVQQTKDLHEIVAVLLASILSQLVVVQIAGEHIPLYNTINVPPLDFNDQFNAIVVGVIAGLFGAFFQVTIEICRNTTLKYIRSFAVRIALAGLVVGSLSIIRPEVWGNGFSTLQRCLREDSSALSLSEAYLIFLLRFLAVIATSAACVPGGVLTPVMTFGGILGLTVGRLMLIPTATGAHQLWVMVGVASLLATMMNAPVVASMMILELTHDYNTILVSIPAAVIALLISSFVKSKIMSFVEEVKKRKNNPGKGTGLMETLASSTKSTSEKKQDCGNNDQKQRKDDVECGDNIVRDDYEHHCECAHEDRVGADINVEYKKNDCKEDDNDDAGLTKAYYGDLDSSPDCAESETSQLAILHKFSHFDKGSSESALL